MSINYNDHITFLAAQCFFGAMGITLRLKQERLLTDHWLTKGKQLAVFLLDNHARFSVFILEVKRTTTSHMPDTRWTIELKVLLLSQNHIISRSVFFILFDFNLMLKSLHGDYMMESFVAA